VTDVKISPDKTWIPVGVAVAGLCSFVVGAFWVGLAYQKILSNQDVQGATLQRLERKLDGVGDEFLTRERFDQFIHLLKVANPSLIVPVVTR
jgi:hypothetical protein